MTSILFAGTALLLLLTSTAPAQENQELGRMWTFENPPLAYLEKEYGFKPDAEWLTALRLGSLRLGGEDIRSEFGSASFVSTSGLILSSIRCVRDAVAATRPRDLDLIKTGFVAAGREQEFRLRSGHDQWLTAAQLIRITDVTDQIDEGVTASDGEAQIKAKRAANENTILEAARIDAPDLVPQIVSLYQGAVLQLYQYKVYDDLRLVCIPHLQVAHFGGDDLTDPRHSLDFAFLRAYEDGKPADSAEHYFPWKSGGANKDELVFVSGNPGTTIRWWTKAQLEFQRDIEIPMRIEWFTNRLRIWKDPAGGTFSGTFDPENPSRHWASVRTEILGLESGLKAARADLKVLRDAEWMAHKSAAEQAFKDRVMADEELEQKYGDLWDRIATVVEERRLREAQARFHSAGGLGLLEAAVAVVRSCDPAETEEARERARKTLESWGTGGIPNFYGRAFFLDHVARARGWLPEDDPFFSKVLGGRSEVEFFEAIYGGVGRVRTQVYLPEHRDALVESGWKAIQDSEDPAVAAARELVVLIREHEAIGGELDAREEVLGAEMGRALLACYGTGVCSDATTTPRFTDGVIRDFVARGVPSGDTVAPDRTTFGELYACSAELDNEYPFNLPKIWLDRRGAVDMAKPVNFVSTNDITGASVIFETNSFGGHRWQSCGGSSGSVVVNEKLEVVGVIVDGHIESLHNDFVFQNDLPRSVSTHVDGIMEALVKVYDAHRVVDELTDG